MQSTFMFEAGMYHLIISHHSLASAVKPTQTKYSVKLDDNSGSRAAHLHQRRSHPQLYCHTEQQTQTCAAPPSTAFQDDSRSTPTPINLILENTPSQART